MGSIADIKPTSAVHLHPSTKKWWKESSIYQIYPASFKDSNGDGIGDIRGIISKLDYVKGLGVDMVWLNPVFCSPQVDMGYDVSDYYNIHPPYGTVEDVDELAKGLKERGMKLIMDLVVNHTSDQHAWFQNALSSKDSPYRDFYIWRKPKVGPDGQRQPPNNWRAYFGGSAWEYHEATGEYYLHLFATEQPDLNWESPHLREEVHKIIRFWLDRGCSGFRMDVINFISKDQDFPDAAVTDPESKWQNGSKYYGCGPRLHEWLKEIGAILNEYDAFSVGEMPEVNDTDEILKAVGADRGELCEIFNFEHVSLDFPPNGNKYQHKDWQMSELKSITGKWQTFMYQNDGWNALYLENHDQPRCVSRFASDAPEYRVLSGKMMATFQGFQAGTPFIYQGQELAMPSVPRSWGIDKYRDIETLNAWKEVVEANPNDEQIKKNLMAEIRLKSRDNARTPVQWDDSAYAGFSTVEPWIPVHDDFASCTAASQINDKNSAYSYWAGILRLRKQYPQTLVYGSFELISEEHPDVFVYSRTSEEGRAVVVLNFRAKDTVWDVPSNIAAECKAGEVLLSNYVKERKLEGSVKLEPLEAFVWLVKW